MERNWDFVSIDDYASDMREQSQMAAGIIRAQRREIEILHAALAGAAKAAGGELSVYDDALQNPKQFSVERDDCHGCYIVKVVGG